MSIELTGGRWVQDGLIRRWTGPRPVDEPLDRADVCDDCGRELVFRSQWIRLTQEERLPTQACRSGLRHCQACDSRRRAHRARHDANANLQIGA